MNRENLTRLADYLAALPANYEHFGMATFRKMRDGYESDPTTIPLECGTVACAIGHAPLALPNLPPNREEAWYDYSDRLFDLSDDEWVWCFSAAWTRVDNTPAGAAARIRWLMENGLPKGSWAQATGRALLCYLVEVEA